MEQVYVVLENSWDENLLSGVFSSEEKAQAFVDSQDNPDDFEIVLQNVQ
jgi:hypothetical protein